MFKLTAKLITFLLLFWLPYAHAAITISSSSILPAQEYTRLTLESKQPIRHSLLTVKNPERLVIDLEDVEIGDSLNSLTHLIGNNNPYIKSVRVGHFKPGVARLVFDLKAEVKPKLTNLKPVAEYGYRLILDIYPAVSTVAQTPTVAQTKPVAVHGKDKVVPRDDAGAVSKPVAAQGKGKGVPQIDTDAVRRIRLAAEQGDAKAQFSLGEMYERGKGVPQDYNEAVRWYRLSAEMPRK